MPKPKRSQPSTSTGTASLIGKKQKISSSNLINSNCTSNQEFNVVNNNNLDRGANVDPTIMEDTVNIAASIENDNGTGADDDSISNSGTPRISSPPTVDLPATLTSSIGSTRISSMPSSDGTATSTPSFVPESQSTNSRSMNGKSTPSSNVHVPRRSNGNLCVPHVRSHSKSNGKQTKLLAKQVDTTKINSIPLNLSTGNQSTLKGTECISQILNGLDNNERINNGGTMLEQLVQMLTEMETDGQHKVFTALLHAAPTQFPEELKTVVLKFMNGVKLGSRGSLVRCNAQNLSHNRLNAGTNDDSKFNPPRVIDTRSPGGADRILPRSWVKMLLCVCQSQKQCNERISNYLTDWMSGILTAIERRELMQIYRKWLRQVKFDIRGRLHEVAKTIFQRLNRAQFAGIDIYSTDCPPIKQTINNNNKKNSGVNDTNNKSITNYSSSTSSSSSSSSSSRNALIDMLVKNSDDNANEQYAFNLLSDEQLAAKSTEAETKDSSVREFDFSIPEEHKQTNPFSLMNETDENDDEEEEEELVGSTITPESNGNSKRCAVIDGIAYSYWSIPTLPQLFFLLRHHHQAKVHHIFVFLQSVKEDDLSERSKAWLKLWIHQYVLLILSDMHDRQFYPEKYPVVNTAACSLDEVGSKLENACYLIEKAYELDSTLAHVHVNVWHGDEENFDDVVDMDLFEYSTSSESQSSESEHSSQFATDSATP